MITLNPGTHKDREMFPFMAEEGIQGHTSYKVFYLDIHDRCSCSEYKTKQTCVHSRELEKYFEAEQDYYKSRGYGYRYF